MFQFLDITKENFEEVIALKMKESQKDFLLSNMYSMAQSKVYPELISKGIYWEKTLIGFAFYKVYDNPKHVFLKRFMIDERYQGKGYGKGSMMDLIDYLSKNYNVDFVELMHYQDNEVASNMYEKCGFVPTGEIRETELVRRHYLK